MTRLTWTPTVLPTASALVLETGAAAELRLLDLRGLDALPATVFESRGPGQAGATALDVSVPARVVEADAKVLTRSWAEFDALRRAISRTFPYAPVRFGEELVRGTLLLERDSFDDLELAAIAVEQHVRRLRGPGLGTLSCEWRSADSPYWRDTADSTIASIAVDADEIAANDGDVDTPFLAQLWGPASAVHLTNETTGEELLVTVALAGDQYLELDTTPARVAVTRVTSGTGVRENYMGGLDLSVSRPFRLRPGNNLLLFEAAGSGGGTHAVVTWRNQYSGI